MERIGYEDIPQEIFEHLRALEGLLSRSGIDKRLLELVKMRVSQLNACAYCLDMHYKELKHSGESDLRISLLPAWEESPQFSEKERAVLAYAEKLTLLSNKALSESVFSAIRQHFSLTEVAYLSLAITQINTWNRLMKAFKFEPGHYKIPA
ncbi:carboxymuconolactone decarboxylase family protein [Poritiphilus flavus]|uniref:Carboxymuconolactone decarboxylase family protein n=1 Tax=Poritiphilus flavus TaxID=2697053 RepID=A0A6L9E9F0_9FLAO|nr:carboxymuconolactone decarboxylase family protein [Poritiphilus flavus]NAS11326.1 carboxymuconolactone decarboxylase family protein [Poritiphilus flavus]